MNIKNKDKLILAYSGSEMATNFLKNDLEDAKIFSLIKNEIQSARLAGLGSSIFNGCQLYIYQKDIEEAKPIIDEFLKREG